MDQLDPLGEEELARLKGSRGPDGRPYMTVPEWLAKEPIEARIQAAERMLVRRPKLAALADVPGSKVELTAAAWEGWSVDQRRAVLRMVVEAVIVRPAGSSGGRFDGGRVHVAWLV